MTYKLPSHLEPYREYIEAEYEGDDTVEDLMSYTNSALTDEVTTMIDLLQRLYDAGLLKTVFKYVVVDKNRKITEKDAKR